MKICALVLCGILPVVVSAQTGRVSVRVIDFETGLIITNAEVRAAFTTRIERGGGAGGGRPNREKGVTGVDGICTLTGSGNGGSISTYAVKDGYYGAGGEKVLFTNVTGAVFKKYEPWDPMINIALSPIGKPIAMYAKRVHNEQIPVQEEAVAYDLEAGDWVAPHGQGGVSDIFFTYSAAPEVAYTNWHGSSPRIFKTYDYRLAVNFNKDDGVICLEEPYGGSGLRLPAKAPEEGYVSSLNKRVYYARNKQGESNIRADQNYFFRVRTVKDAEGNILGALYGKIHGDFQFNQRGGLTFTYYLNPTSNDRNVEFDPKRNLFKNLTSLEEVHAP